MDNLELLDQALTHPTYAFEKGLGRHNQRLEFLGDAVLGVIIADYLYRYFSYLPEGDLTRMRAAIVCESSLVKAAKQFNLGELLLLGQGEETSGGRERQSNLADAMEAIIGSVYLHGFELARDFVLKVFAGSLEVLENLGVMDSKSALQELVQRIGPENVTYKIIDEEGPPHARRYKVGVYHRNRILADGEGSSKKEAEQNAARAALAMLKIQD